MTLAFVLLGDCPINIRIDYIEFQRCSKYEERVIGCHYERQVQGDNRFCMRRAANRHEVRMPRRQWTEELKGTASRSEAEDRHPSPPKSMSDKSTNACRLEPPLQLCISAGVRRYHGGRARERRYVH